MNPTELLINQVRIQMEESSIKTSTVNVLLGKDFNGDVFEDFLYSENERVRLEASRIVGIKGDASKLKVLLNDDSKQVLLRVVKLMSDAKRGMETLVSLLSNKHYIIKEETIGALWKAGKAKYLAVLLFDKNPNLVKRIKRYIDAQRRQ